MSTWSFANTLAAKISFAISEKNFGRDYLFIAHPKSCAKETPFMGLLLNSHIIWYDYCMNTYEYGIHERFMGPLLKHVINVLGVIGRVIQTSERMAPFKLCTKSSVNRGSGPNWQEYLPWLDVICNFDVLILLLWPNLVALDSLDFAHLYESAKKNQWMGLGVFLRQYRLYQKWMALLSSSLLCLLHAPPSPQLLPTDIPAHFSPTKIFTDSYPRS